MAVDDRYIKNILNMPFAGENYSERIWGNCSEFERVLNRTVTNGLVTGKSYDEIVSDMQKKLDADKWKIERLVRTEGTFIANQASLRGYEEAGIKYYRFVARLDARTSPLCRELNGKIFEVTKAQAGENLPPLHPWCRSTTVPVWNKEKEENEEIEEIMKGKKSEEELRKEYDFLLSLGDKNSHRIDNVSMHPFQTFRMYKTKYNKSFDMIAGIEIKGTKIKNLSAHAVKRMIDRDISP